PFDRDLEAAVLGYATLGDVQLRHHLDPREDLLRHLVSGDGGDAYQHAIDAITNHQSIADCLEMDVAGARAQRVEHGGVHQLDDGTRVFVYRGEREVFDRLRVTRAPLSVFHGGVDGAHRLFARRDVRHDFGACGDRPFEQLRRVRLHPR